MNLRKISEMIRKQANESDEDIAKKEYKLSIQTSRRSLHENIIEKIPEFAYLYAKNVLRGRFISAEDEIAKSPEFAVKYAYFVLGRTFIKAEPNIKRDKFWQRKYEENILGLYPETGIEGKFTNLRF